MRGTNGNDVMRGYAGDDELFGSRGDDVMVGGRGADTFVFSAGAIDDGGVDFITDFKLTQGDMLQFLDSASGAFNILSVEVENNGTTEANGVSLANNTWRENDIVFTVEHAETGDTQEIFLLDAWSEGNNGEWEAILEALGTGFGSAEEELEVDICDSGIDVVCEIYEII